jgi:hypothetical protein
MSALSNLFPGGFDSNAVKPDEGRDYAPMPAGAYTVEISNAEVKDLASGNGTGLKLEFTVIDPEQFARRKVWANLNIKHSNTQAEEIGQAQLSALCHAVGIPVLKDSDQLFQKILRVRLKVKPAQGTYSAGNEVTAYESMGAQQPGPSVSRPAANAPVPAAAGAKKAPWAK